MIYFISGCAISAAGIMHYALCWQIAILTFTIKFSGVVYDEPANYVSPLAHISFVASICVAILLWSKARKET